MKFFSACATWYSAGLPALFCLFALGMPSHAIEPDAFIPPDTEFVMNLRPRQILESPFLKSQGWDVLLKTLLATNDTVQQILESTGIDPFKDVESLQVAAKGQGPESQVLAVIRGKFSPKKIAKVVEEQGENSGAPVKKIKENGITLWELKTPAASLYIAFDENKAVLASTTKDYLVTALNGGFKESVNTELRTALEKVSGKEGMWMAGVITEQARKGMDRSDDLKPLADKMESWAASFDLTDTVKLALDMYTKDPATARSLKDLTENKFFPFLKNLPPVQNPAVKKRMDTMMKQLKIEAKGKAVMGRLTVDAEMLKSLLLQ
ncbi:MAG: hypothetical protein DWH82_02695 [Planctomycetota bacterium]|nr:MAG: hypothetical protein DWH82_02695 [Planctomycetota bacterium]